MVRKRQHRRRGATRRVSAGRIVLALVTTLALGFVVVLAWAGVGAVRALPHIERAQQVAAGLDMQSVLAGDTSQVDELQNELAAARSNTSGPAWRLAEGVPWVGPQFTATRTLTETLDDLASDGLATAAEAGDGVDALLPREGQVDVAGLSALNAQVESALVSVTDARARLATIEPAGVVGPLRDGTAQIDELLAEIEPTLEGTSRATSLLPGFLGAEGQREHLLLLQNSAEWRSQGGIIGSVIKLTATDGEIEFSDQLPGRSFSSEEAVTPLEFDTELIFGDRPARYMQNPTMIPDFAEAAHVAREFWKADQGGDTTGVIAIDPVTLSYLLEATGPLELPTGDVISSENAVQLLLNEAYLRYEDPAEQDVFFGVAADAVFEALLSDDVDPVTAVQAITRAVDERRLLVWSADEEERALLEDTSVSGAMPVSDDDNTAFGVYLNDGVGAKLDYYMAAGSSVAWCSDATASLRVTLRNDAPEDISDYPDYLLGTSGEETQSGVPRGINRTLAYVYLPEGAELTGDAGEAQLAGQHDGRNVYEWTTDLAPGESATLDVQAQTNTGDQLDVVSTPVLTDVDVEPEC
ncbi:DUF4012 domain-containing protein [Nesterenkonia sp. AY15]|uniref:DUF4012 domain-containing protein n=1 Tax=Nesterenkonia sp. AY15 TaxID=2901139 RepID=UPI001F4CA1DC|nr:DUF4012 domain-containing protein [Nesterenkonia sp. AY15]MCH8570455.1 DUF4012 domain-containing protein [Nesterenkonia sp. AY15]